MKRDLLITSTLMLGGLVACSEVPHERLFDFWDSLGEDGDTSGGDDSDPFDSSGSDDSDGESDSGDGDPDDPGDGDPGDGETGDDDACVAVSEQADLVQTPADIIFVVDNSYGMTEEAIFVETQMNGFAAQLEASGIDHHIVLISAYPDGGNGICVDPPLGSGSCPNYDNNLPVYRHVDEDVGGHDALETLLETHSEWKDSIRPDSVKHIIVVSDDESDLGAHHFESQFSDLDSSYDPFVVHAITCPWDCSASGAIGQTYVDLVSDTGGVLGDLCQQNFGVVFDDLAHAVIQSVPSSCKFNIPPPPIGMNLDPSLVNVELNDGNGNIEDIPRVLDFADCMNQPEGWFYDDPVKPAQIFLCPQTCAKVQGYEFGVTNVKFGCETLMPQ